MATTSTPRALTPAQLETRLRRAFDDVRDAYHDAHGFGGPSRRRAFITGQQANAARVAYAVHRARAGVTSSAALLSEDIGKTQKNHVRTYALAFLPANTSGIANTCAFEDKCAATCVAFSGKGDMPDVRRARALRLSFAVEHPEHFAALLVAELFRIEEAAASAMLDAMNDHGPFGAFDTRKAFRLVRLNAYSDIRWERVAPWLFAACGHVGFYDYTKHTAASRPANTLPENYRLTYSVSTRSTLGEVLENIRTGRNVAAVFEARAHSKNDALPVDWCALRVVDGDADDDRYHEPRGVVVGLRRKGTLAAGGDLVTASRTLGDMHRDMLAAQGITAASRSEVAR